MRRRLILLDIDGTLVGSTHRIPAGAVLAIKAAQANGHLVMICTGRSKPEIEPHILEPGFDGLLAVSGAYIEIGGEVKADRFISPEAVTRASAAYNRLGVDYLWQSSKGMWATEGYMRALRVEERFGDDAEKRASWHDIGPMLDLARDRGCGVGDLVPASKGTFLVLDGSGTTVDDVRRAIGDDLVTINGSMGAFARVNGEVMAPGVDKGTALEYAARTVGVDIRDTIAIGDSDNDLPMLERAGVAVAMGNGTESVKRVADLVTDGVDEGGVLNALFQLDLL